MKKVILLSTAILSISSSVCMANASNTETVEVSGKDLHFNYNESIGDSERGWIKGYHLSYKSQDKETKAYWKVSYDHSHGNTVYDGAVTNITTNVSTPYVGTTNNTVSDTEVTYGVPINKKATQYVYVGVGYHKWDRDMLGQYGYDEQYSWNYLPVGYRYEYTSGSKVHGAIDASVQFMFNGKMNSSDNGADYNLGNQPGFKIEAPVTYQMSPKFGLVLTPWFQYSSIGQSNTIEYTAAYGGNLYDISSNEPHSMNHQYGVNLGLSYTF